MEELLKEIKKKQENGANCYYCYQDLTNKEQKHLAAKGYRLFPQTGQQYTFIIRW